MRNPTPRFGRSSRFAVHGLLVVVATVVADVSPAIPPLRLEVQPTRLPLQLQSILLQPPVERAPAPSQRFRRLPRISTGTGQRLLNKVRFHFLETHLFQSTRVP